MNLKVRWLPGQLINKLNLMHYTNQQYKDLLASCNWKDEGAVSKLITSSYTDVKFNEKVIEKHINNPIGAYNYFREFFNTAVWPDGQGLDEVREYATDAYIPFTFSHFIRQMKICDPSLANECDTDYCQIPEGGRGTLPGLHFYKWGFETPRSCIANIRHIRAYQYWAKRVLQARESVDNQVMNMFFTMAGIQTAGHKYILQGMTNPSPGGGLVPIPNGNPRNPFRKYAYNYMEELFPAVTDPNKIMPLTLNVLDELARYWTFFMPGNHVAVGDRGQYIWEIWTSEDFYLEHYYDNPDYAEKIKATMPAKMFPGFSLFDNERTVLGNWVGRTVPMLPRFTESTEGGLIAVDSHEAVDIEVGQEWVGGLEYQNAPIGLALIPSKKQGTIFTRPDLTTSGDGFPILPITGAGPWRIRNDYDKECNKDLNKPYSQKRYEMGFRMDDPDGGTAILYRRRNFRTSPINECDLMPIARKTPNTVDCPVTTIGCGDTRVRQSDSITQTDFSTRVECYMPACSTAADNAAPYLYRIQIKRQANQPDFNSLGCACGSTIVGIIHNEAGAFVRQQDFIVKDNSLQFPYGYYFLETNTKLAVGECIVAVICQDATPDLGNVVSAWDNTMEGFEDLPNGTVRYMTDSVLSCTEGDDVIVTFKDASGATLGTINATISEADPEHFLYTIAGTGLLANKYPTQATVTITCD